jgi:ribosomal protein S14
MVKIIRNSLMFRGDAARFVSSRMIALCQLLTLEYRFFAYRQWSTANIRKQKTVCLLTGRGRGLVSLYGTSRLTFKDYATKGVYGGLKKFVW